MAGARNYLAWQSRLITPELGRRVVEIGCGLGNFTEKLLDRDLVVALDIEPDCIERLQRRYPRQQNLHTFVGDTGSDLFSGLARFRPDSCLCVNVLEHIEDDADALVRMASILEPRGVIVLWVPAFPALYGAVDRNLGHYRRYWRADIARLAFLAGLDLQKVHYANLAGFFAWWFNSHILRRSALSQMQIDVFDRLVAPVFSRLEQSTPPPFGQSLFAVLRKS